MLFPPAGWRAGSFVSIRGGIDTSLQNLLLRLLYSMHSLSLSRNLANILNRAIKIKE